MTPTDFRVGEALIPVGATPEFARATWDAGIPISAALQIIDAGDRELHTSSLMAAPHEILALGGIFTFVPWATNDFGGVASRFDILRAVTTHERYSTAAYVRPGADILLAAIGWPDVEMVLKIFDAAEAIGIDAIEVSSGHWRHAHRRLAAQETPGPYIRQRHEAWLLLCRIEL